MRSQTPHTYPQFPLRRFVNEMADGPFGSSLTSSHYSDEGARVVRLGNIGSARFKDADAAFIPMSHFRELRRHEVKAGDLLIAGLGDDRHPVGRACIAPDHLGPAIVKADCYRVRLDENRLTHRFAAWALGSSTVSDQVSASTRGSTRSRINLEVAREIHLPIPPVEEQRRIAEFLDAETARIDTVALKRRQMKDLLALKRNRIIDAELGFTGRASSHGLTPLKYLVEEITVGIVITPAKWYVKNGGVPALRGLNVQPSRIETKDLAHISEEGHAENWKSRLHAGDIVIVRTGQAGAAAVVPASLNGANCIDLILVRPGRGLSPAYVQYVLNSDYARERVSEHAVGSIQAHFNVGAMKQLPMPSLSRPQQDAVVESLDRKIGRIDQLMEKLKVQEALLTERRQALIATAVTGQIDVSTASGRGIEE